MNIGKLLIVLAIALAVTITLTACATERDGECYSSVKVTGYYTPAISDYAATKQRKILVDANVEAHNATFLDFAMIKGAGISLDDQVLLYEQKIWTYRKEAPTKEEKKWFPLEVDYVAMRTITTREDSRERMYPKAFVDETGLQGSGVITEGEVLGWPWDCSTSDGTPSYLSAECDSQWHAYHAALDATGKPIKRGVVATDKKFFDRAQPWHVTISPIPAGFAGESFEARDLGPAITESRVDVYTGHALDGLRAAIALTGTYRVCFAH